MYGIDHKIDSISQIGRIRETHISIGASRISYRKYNIGKFINVLRASATARIIKNAEDQCNKINHFLPEIRKRKAKPTEIIPKKRISHVHAV
jgi:hypothetical protein